MVSNKEILEYLNAFSDEEDKREAFEELKKQKNKIKQPKKIKNKPKRQNKIKKTKKTKKSKDFLPLFDFHDDIFQKNNESLSSFRKFNFHNDIFEPINSSREPQQIEKDFKGARKLFRIDIKNKKYNVTIVIILIFFKHYFCC